MNFALKHPALLALMFEAKYRPGAPRELIEATERAFSHTPAAFAEAQAKGEVVPGDPARMALPISAALLGLISISTNGKIKGIPLDQWVGEIIERMILGFRPR